MSGKRIIRFIIGLALSLVIVPVILPFCGVPRSQYLPPQWVYAQATGKTKGVVLSERYAVSNNPFQVGVRLFYIDYVFLAKPPSGPIKKPQHYYGEVQVDKATYDAVNPNQTAPIKYEVTNPNVNGIDIPTVGEGCNPANNILGPWLIWLGVVFALAVVFLLIFDRMGDKEDI